jgi:hypothetical protein
MPVLFKKKVPVLFKLKPKLKQVEDGIIPESTVKFTTGITDAEELNNQTKIQKEIVTELFKFYTSENTTCKLLKEIISVIEQDTLTTEETVGDTETI